MELTTPDLVVLSYLSRSPAHGYALWQTLEAHEVRDWAGISRPQVYYSLKKLAAANLLRDTPNAELALGPDKQTFTVTSAGKKALAKALKSPTWGAQRPPPPFLTWLALSSHLEADDLAPVIEARRRFLEQELSKERSTLAEIDAEAERAAYLMVTLTCRQFAVELEWLDDVETMARLPATLPR